MNIRVTQLARPTGKEAYDPAWQKWWYAKTGEGDPSRDLYLTYHAFIGGWSAGVAKAMDRLIESEALRGTAQRGREQECDAVPTKAMASPSTRLRAALQACHWSVRHVAPLIQWDERSIRHWLSGRYDPPADVLAWVERLAAAHSANPPPERVRRSG